MIRDTVKGLLSAVPLLGFQGGTNSVVLSTAPLQVDPVQNTRDREEFLRLPFALYANDPNWVPDVLAERRDFLNPDRNPFFQHAEVQLFIARRGLQVVGRIAAINHPAYNQFHDTEYGLFGMFECVDDQAVADGLFKAAADWSRARGMKTMLGPANFSTNRECGLLTHGYDTPSAMFMTYNPPYYVRLVEKAGFTNAKDLWSYELSTSVAPPENVVRRAEAVRASGEVTVRPIRIEDLAEETRRIKSIYDSMLAQVWGYMPMSDDEFEVVAARVRPLVQIRPELCLIAEMNGEPVAYSLTLPDANVAIRAAGGRLTQFGLPLGLLKMAWASRSIERLRVLLFGQRPGLQIKGIDALLYLESLHAARRLGYETVELGWTTEDYELYNRAIESIGARRIKSWRMYERPL